MKNSTIFSRAILLFIIYSLLFASPLFAQTPTVVTSGNGDVNNDGKADIQDILIVLKNYGVSATSVGGVNQYGDSIINLFDYYVVFNAMVYPTITPSKTPTPTVFSPTKTPTPPAVTPTPTGNNGTPYGGSPWRIPGVIEFEDYNEGGEGVAYHDIDTANNGGQYRTGGVDIGATSDGAGSRFEVGWLSKGEWLKYTVNIQTAGLYEIKIRGGLADYQRNLPATIHLEINGVSITPSLQLYQGPYWWQGYSTLPKAGDNPIFVNLPAGVHTLKLVVDSALGGGTLNYVYFKLIDPKPPVVSIIYPTPIPDQIYYVSPNGNDSNPGSASQPWKTITKAASTLTAGQTVYINAGIYRERLDVKNSGEEGKYIIFMRNPSASSGSVIIDGNGVTIPILEGLVNAVGKKYIRFSGLKVINAGVGVNDGTWNMGIALQKSDHIIIDNNYVGNTYSSGIVVSQASNNVVVDGNELAGTNFGSNDGEVALGIDWFSNNVEVKNNVLHDGHNEGIDPVAGVHDVKIHHNTAYNMGRQGFYVDSWTEYEKDIEFYSNIAYGNGKGNGQGGFLISSEEGGILENIKIYNNIAYDNIGEGFSITSIGGTSSHIIRNIYLVNNTAYRNGRDGILVDNPEATNIFIRNNIAYANVNQITVKAGQVVLDKNLTTNPSFINAPVDFHLKAGSAAIDTGSSTQFVPNFDFDGKTRPNGAGFDIGAFEYY